MSKFLMLPADGGASIDPAIEGRVTALEDKNVRASWYEQIIAGTSGTLAPPSGGSIVLDAFADGVDALVCGLEAGIPNYENVTTAGGAVVAATLDSSGNWTLSGAPAAYPVALIFVYRVKLVDFDDTKSLSEVRIEEVVTVASPLTKSPAGVVSIPVATSGANGYLSSADWSAFSAKVDSASNLGATGVSVYKQKTGTGLEFRKLIAGSGVTLTQNADDVTIDAAGGSADVWTRRQTEIEIEDDFERGVTTSGQIGTLGWLSVLSSGNVTGSVTPTLSNIFGFVGVDTGTATNGGGALTFGFSTGGTNQYGTLSTTQELKVGSIVVVETLSTTSERFLFQSGLMPYNVTHNTTTPSDGIYFEYDESLSANWRLVCSSSSSNTVVTTSVAVVAGVLVSLYFEHNTATNAIEFYIDGASVGSISTNVPFTRDAMTPRVKIRKSVGTTLRKFVIDYFYMRKGIA